jgi:hypothetical protein
MFGRLAVIVLIGAVLVGDVAFVIGMSKDVFG